MWSDLQSFWGRKSARSRAGRTQIISCVREGTWLHITCHGRDVCLDRMWPEDLSRTPRALSQSKCPMEQPLILPATYSRAVDFLFCLCLNRKDMWCEIHDGTDPVDLKFLSPLFFRRDVNPHCILFIVFKVIWLLVGQNALTVFACFLLQRETMNWAATSQTRQGDLFFGATHFSMRRTKCLNTLFNLFWNRDLIALLAKSE
jgi:hypothetical protein